MDENTKRNWPNGWRAGQSTMSHLPDGVVLMDKLTNLEWTNPVAGRAFPTGFYSAIWAHVDWCIWYAIPELVKVIQSQNTINRSNSGIWGCL